MTRRDSSTAQIADLWVDPLCPFAWITSRWLLEAATVRPIEPRFHVMSLALLNEGRDLPEEYRQMMEGALGPVRVMIAAQQAHGPEVMRPLYDAMGERMHVDGRGGAPDVVVDSLRAVGLPEALADAATSTEYDAALRSSHDAGMAKVGTDVGTPVLSVGGQAIFGPVVTPAPKGEAAGLLWDGVLLVIGTEGFFELKRTRDRDLSFD